MGGFEGLHPGTLFLYYMLLIFAAVITLNPVLAVISLLGGILYYLLMAEWKKFLKDFLFYTIVLLIIAISNPIFSHNGQTIILYVNDNPVTFEAIIYGAFAGAMVAAVMFWCKCFGKIMTTDKFLYLFGKAVPKVSVILSMSVRFLPLFKRQSEIVTDVQKIMGFQKSHGRIGGSLRIFDSVIGWSMENSVDTADAMAARGFGMGRRTTYSIFRVGIYDYITWGIMSVFAAIFIYGMVNGIYEYSYYPVIDNLKAGREAIVVYLMHGVFSVFPFAYTLVSQIMMDRNFRNSKEQSEWM